MISKLVHQPSSLSGINSLDKKIYNFLHPFFEIYYELSFFFIMFLVSHLVGLFVIASPLLHVGDPDYYSQPALTSYTYSAIFLCAVVSLYQKYCVPTNILRKLTSPNLFHWIDHKYNLNTTLKRRCSGWIRNQDLKTSLLQVRPRNRRQSAIIPRTASNWILR